MFLKSLKLKGFRVYSESVFEFTPETNLICGPNAMGKTSVLEAIYFLMTGRSFRTSTLQDLIKNGEEGLQVEATFVKHDIEQQLRITLSGKNRHIQHNHTHYSTLSRVLGIMQGVVMSPDDAALVKGAPGIRRRFIDMHIAQLDPNYVHHLARYYRAMKHRNHLLKQNEYATIESWEQEMAGSAAYIVSKRVDTIDELQNYIAAIHVPLTGEREDLFLKYKSEYQTKEDFLAQYEKLRPREAVLGSTLTGPHRDDFQLLIGTQDTRHFASEGQQRSCVASLMFAKWTRIKNITGLSPMMLIDDVGMSLDQTRREKFFSHLGNLSQVILTSTHPLPGINHVLLPAPVPLPILI